MLLLYEYRTENSYVTYYEPCLNEVITSAPSFAMYVDLKQQIHVIIQSKHFCLLDFFLRI